MFQKNQQFPNSFKKNIDTSTPTLDVTVIRITWTVWILKSIRCAARFIYFLLRNDVIETMLAAVCTLEREGENETHGEREEEIYVNLRTQGFDFDMLECQFVPGLPIHTKQFIFSTCATYFALYRVQWMMCCRPNTSKKSPRRCPCVVAICPRSWKAIGVQSSFGGFSARSWRMVTHIHLYY